MLKTILCDDLSFGEQALFTRNFCKVYADAERYNYRIQRPLERLDIAALSTQLFAPTMTIDNRISLNSILSHIRFDERKARVARMLVHIAFPNEDPRRFDYTILLLQTPLDADIPPIPSL